MNVVFSIGEDTQEGTDPINIDWEDAEAVMTVIICNSSFDVNGEPSIDIDEPTAALLIFIWRTMSITLTMILSSVMVSP